MLTDESPMPFGLHEGKAMANVPADYLLFLWEKNSNKRTYGKMSDVLVYINDNLDALRKETNK